MSALSFSSQNSNPHQNLVGLRINDDSARSQLSSLRAAGVTVRVVAPNGMVTGDYRTDRVTMRVDASGKITSVVHG